MDKDTALYELRAARDEFLFGVASFAMLSRAERRKEISGTRVILNGRGIFILPEDEQHPERQSRLSMEVAFGNVDRAAAERAVQALKRALLFRSFEVVKSYANSRGELSTAKSQSWWGFARALRNAYAHDGRWDLGSRTQPLRWNNRAVDLREHGQPVDPSFPSWFDAMNLWGAMFNYVALEEGSATGGQGSAGG